MEIVKKLLKELEEEIKEVKENNEKNVIILNALKASATK